MPLQLQAKSICTLPWKRICRALCYSERRYINVPIQYLTYSGNPRRYRVTMAAPPRPRLCWRASMASRTWRSPASPRSCQHSSAHWASPTMQYHEKRRLQIQSKVGIHCPNVHKHMDPKQGWTGHEGNVRWAGLVPTNLQWIMGWPCHDHAQAGFETQSAPGPKDTFLGPKNTCLGPKGTCFGPKGTCLGQKDIFILLLWSKA